MVKGIKKVLVSGFVASLVLATALTAQAAPTRPYAGANRYETADKILAEGWTSANVAILASGADANLPDALSVAPLAKKENAPLVFVEPNNDASLDAAVNKLVSLGVKKVYIATGTGVISSNAETKLAAKNITVERLGGANRYATALNIAKKVGTSNKVAVVSTENGIYADAVSIAPIAAVEGMPVLFTDGNTLTPEVKDYITNTLKPATSYVVGGTGAVSDEVAKLLTNVTRFAGTDRYDTNFKAIDAFKADLKFDTVYVTSGSVFADALAVSPYAAKTASPVVLASSELNTQVTDLLKAKMYKTGAIKIVGGTGAVSTALEAKLQNILDNAQSAVKTGKATVNVNFSTALPAIKQVTVSSQVAGAAQYKVGSSAVVALGQNAQLFLSDATKPVDLTIYAADGKTVVATGKVDLSVKGSVTIDVVLNDVVVVSPSAKAAVNVNFSTALPAIKQVTLTTQVTGAAKYKVGSSAVVALGEKAQLFVSDATKPVDVTIYAADGTTVVATGKVDLSVKGDANIDLTVAGNTVPTPVENKAVANVNFSAALPAIKQVTVTGTVAGAAKYSVGSSAVVAIGEKAQLFVTDASKPATVTFFAADGTTVVATASVDLNVKGDVTLTVTAK